MTTTFGRRCVAIGVSGLALAAAPLAAVADDKKKEGEKPFRPVNLEKGAEAPGVRQLLELGDYIGMYALLVASIGALLSVAILAIGPRLGFDGASRVGKIGIIVCILVAFFVGALPMMLNFAFNMGLQA